MSDILEQIAEHNRTIYLDKKLDIPLSKMMDMAYAASGTGFAFEKTLKEDGMSFICEIKKASPSKGIIDPVFDYLSIARAYEAAGADCISCLTEPRWFMGSDDIFREIRRTVRTPMIRKDFIVDEYQLYQSKLMGANCVLLICALLDLPVLAIMHKSLIFPTAPSTWAAILGMAIFPTSIAFVAWGEAMARLPLWQLNLEPG